MKGQARLSGDGLGMEAPVASKCRALLGQLGAVM